MSDIARCIYFDSVPAQLQPLQCSKTVIFRGLCADHATRRYGEAEWLRLWNQQRQETA
jgi:hypothetical protein